MPDNPAALSHNAVAALVQMYAAILQDYERREALLKGQLAASREEVRALEKERAGMAELRKEERCASR
jgi:hypothetical protein